MCLWNTDAPSSNKVKQIKGASNMQIAELQKPFEWTWNPWLFSIPNSPRPLTKKAHPWLIRSRCMKFHDHRWITESVMVWKRFSITNAPWPWHLDLKINRVHPWLMGSMCMKFHCYISKGIWHTVRKPIVDAHSPAHRNSAKNGKNL